MHKNRKVFLLTFVDLFSYFFVDISIEKAVYVFRKIVFPRTGYAPVWTMGSCVGHEPGQRHSHILLPVMTFMVWGRMVSAPLAVVCG